MQEEYEALIKNITWTLVSPPLLSYIDAFQANQAGLKLYGVV